MTQDEMRHQSSLWNLRRSDAKGPDFIQGAFVKLCEALADLADEQANFKNGITKLYDWQKEIRDEVKALRERVDQLPLCHTTYEGYECRLLRGHTGEHEYE